MKKYRIFVSGVQKELTQERRAVKDFISNDALLRKHFDTFLFEELPATSKSANVAYLKEVDASDIYLGLLGNEYGLQGANGFSATEREFDRAVKKGKEILIFIKGKDDTKRDKKLNVLLNKIKASDSGYIYKRFNTITEMKKNVYNSLMEYLETKGVISGVPFDSRVCEDAAYKNINEKIVKDFLANRAIKLKVAVPEISIKDFLVKTIKVVKFINRTLKPTNTAVLFFCNNPQDFISQSAVKIARYRGTARIEFLDSRELEGPFYKILEDVETFFERNTRLANKIVEWKRVDIPEYPFKAIREGVINAMAHRDYNRGGANIQIDIFDDRTEITSPGGLLPGLNIKRLEGVHETRNKEICKIFHETKDMEKYGTGIRKMNNLMKQHGLKPPVLIQPGDFFRIIFYGPGDKILDLVSDIPENRQTDLKELGLNERQIEALRLMVNERRKFTNRKFRQLFKVTNKTAATDLNMLVKIGMVQLSGKGRSVEYSAK